MDDWSPGQPAALIPPNLATCVMMVSVGRRCGGTVKALVTVDSSVVTMQGAPACSEHLAEMQGTFPAHEVSWTKLV